MTSLWKKITTSDPVVIDGPKLTPPSLDPSSLGNILIDLGVISFSELQQVLARQKVIGEGVLGALACEAGYCTTRDVAKAMEIQASMREGREAEAAIGFLGAATEEMSAQAKKLSDTIRGARIRAHERGEKTGLLLLLRPTS